MLQVRLASHGNLESENMMRNPVCMTYQMCDWVRDLNFYIQNGVVLHNLQIM